LLSWSERGTVNPYVIGWIPSKTRRAENSISHGFELHRPLIKETKLLLKVIKAIIIHTNRRRYLHLWIRRRGWKASAISKPDVRLSENIELLCITASGVSFLQPSAGTPWRPTTTARGNGTFRQRSVRPLMMNGRQILVHLGLFSGIRRLHNEIIKFHARQNIVVTLEETTSFYGRRPDGVAFDAKLKQCMFLEFARPMGSVSSSDEGDWAERKELEKNERYCMHIYFINYLSASMELYTSQLHSWSTRLEDPIPRQTLPSRGDEL